MVCIFINVLCKPGTTYDVANALSEKELHSEMYSISGDFDLLLKVYVPENEDIGRFVNDHILTVKNIERTRTTIAFKAF